MRLWSLLLERKTTVSQTAYGFFRLRSGLYRAEF
jgi:hypothetical protein